jgi:hypothetical protein
VSQIASDLLTDYDRTAALNERRTCTVFASKRRRILLDVLDGETTPLDLDELASTIAERETCFDERAEKSTEQVSTSLHHVHLPMLDDFGVLDYHPETNRISP